MFLPAVTGLSLKMEGEEIDTNKIPEPEIKEDPSDAPTEPEKSDEEKAEREEGEYGEKGEDEVQVLSEDVQALKEELDKIIVSPPEPQKS